MRVGVRIITCASMRAALVDARGRMYYQLCQLACVLSLVPACVQRLWMGVGVSIINWDSKRAALVDACGQAYSQLCQHACSSALACVLPLVVA